MALYQATFFSHALSRSVPFVALIPNDLSSKQLIGCEKHYQRATKTLYLLHGYCGNCNDWTVNSGISALSTKYNLAVIMPSGDNAFYIDGKGTGKAYGDYTGRELVDYTRKTFGFSEKREDTFIGGLSMGGFGAIRNALKYNHTFSKVAGLSSAMILNGIKHMKEGGYYEVADYDYYVATFGDPKKLETSDSNPEHLLAELIKNNEPIPEMYLACGTEDFLFEQNKEFKAFLDKNGVASTYIEDEGVHNWDYWNKHLEPAIQWMLNES